ncbi:uncharacterized protein LOC114522435 [Dendronephthya gigantea]|uniref:uncharacterized protein LOC114522435 n=1 Tax=Dendronephthya gigantea TaxID=151771 RepID=UPI001069C379|nr:uncharacterized protein LOC114522435 [Dendronephthya gigantea]
MKLILVCLAFLLFQHVSGWRRRRRRRSPPPTPPRNCQVGPWSGWSACTHHCGNAGTQRRTRGKTVAECCGGTCTAHFSETRACNRNACRNGGRPTHGHCICNAGWTGTCCERDVNECLRKPCQHNCHNVLGSYTCSCYSCYTKVGTKCELRQCRIGNVCYPYGRINPGNKCQDCQKGRETVWTNNNALSCSDGNLCTRNDRCVNGACRGTAFTCRSCESCDGNGCKIKPGYCVIDGRCYRNGNLRPGKPCQQCNSNNPTRWTANNNLKCSDNNVKTRNDRCVNGECRGQPYTCLPCQDHHNDACRLKSGYCIIKHNNVDTCYRANTAKPGNPCQWCHPGTTTSAWTNRNGISCDDGQKCTRSDKCTNGQCGGISFKCNSLCQYCNGNDCSLHTGFGYVAGKCTCKIAGKDYNHQQLNPSNECQWCDLYHKASKASSMWANRPALACNDGNACTKQDLCNNGRCVGKAYNCRSSYPQSSCIHRSECVGDGTCRDIMRNKGTICQPAVDKCDQPERCNGVLGTCSSRIVDKITLSSGQIVLTLPNFANAIAYQSTTDKLYLKLTGFTVTCGALNIKWSLLKSKDSCALGKNPGSLTNSINHVLSGLTLRNSEIYKVVVQAYDMRGQSGLPVCSNALTIDTSKPSGGWIRDGLGSSDVQFQSSKKISASWGGFKTTHGIAKYEVAVYSKNNPLQTFTNVNLAASFTKTFSAITDGSKIVTKVRAFTKAGLYSEIFSNGVTVDTSNPTPGKVIDGNSNDLKYASWTATYNASWTSFTDPHAPIVEYKLAVKRKNAGLVGSGFTSVGSKRAGSISGLRLTSGIEYCAIVEGMNAAGLSSQATSDCLLIDHDAPRPGTVNDGTSGDIDYQSGDNVFHANWNGFSDGQKGSGIAEYRYKLTDKKTSQVITQWASSGLQTKATITGLNLANGNTYFITVRAVDKVGHYTEASSDGIFIDTTHPVYTGSISVQGETAQKGGETLVYIRSKESVTVSWPQFLDEHSGMLKYQWSIVEKNKKPSSWKDVPGVNLATKAVLSSLSLTNNKEYQLTIRGINNAGLYADIKSPIIIPLSIPTNLGSVSDGEDPTTDIDYQTNTSEVHATWKGFETPSVKVRAYFYAVGSCIKGNYHVTNNQFTPVSPATTTSLEMRELNLVNGQKYCVKIKAENLAGVQTEAVSSDGFVVDVTPPDLSRAMVLDGSGDDDIDYQSSRGELSATWKGIRDDDSGIHHFEVAVSRNRVGAPDVTSFNDVGRNTSAKISELTLNDEVYYIIVCAVNNAGLKSCLASDGVLIDPTPSTSGVVHDGILEPDVRYQSSTKKMSANWERVWDLESRVARFEWGIEKDDNGVVLDFVNVGLQTHVTSHKTLPLKHGHNYTVVLRVYNRAGGMRELKSNGVTIDTTPPVPSHITLGSEWRFNKETGTYYTSTASGIYVTWKDFKERESKVWYYKWSIGTTKCGTQLQPLINIGSSTRANTTGSELNFRPGTPYYVTVVARNRADLVSRACSSPLLFDYTPPIAGRIQITSRAGVEKSYFSSTEDPPRMGWSGFYDLESDIEKYKISVVKSNASLKNYAFNSSNALYDVPLGNLSPGTGYSVVLKVINYAGLETAVYSKPFAIDDSPPYYTGRAPRQEFQSDTTSVEIAWEPFSDNESPVEFYEIGLGTSALQDDIHEFTRTGLRTYVKLSGLDLKDDQTYYVTVRASNAAGLRRSLLLKEIEIDKTPPTGKNDSVKDGLSGSDVDFINSNDTVSATWENIEEQQSFMSLFEYCVGTTPYNCLIKSFTQIGLNKSFQCDDCRIKSDMKVFARVRATNAVGLSAIFVSDGVTVDSSPPEIGRVLDGESAESPDVEKVDRDWLPTVTWYGAQDIQSGLRDCEWIIVKHDGNGMSIAYVKMLDKVNITYNNRHTERATSQLELAKNASYVNAIRCSNNAGIIHYQYSNGWSVVDEWPVTSYVNDGLGSSDLEYDVTGKTLGASWGQFHGDSKDPVIRYEWAVGTLGTPDDIMDFTDVGLDTRASKSLTDGEIVLDTGVRCYVTVRATTLSGRTSNKSSNGFIVDTTAPTVGVVKVSHKIIKQETNEVDYTLTWSGFRDLETGIRKFEFCLGYIKDVCSTVLTTAGLDQQGTVQQFTPADLATPFYGIVIATNNAGLTTIVSSDSIKIDFTPPIPGTVIDGLHKDLDNIAIDTALISTWSAFTDPETGIERCTLTVIEKSPKNEDFPVLRKLVNASGSITHKFIVVPGLRYVSTVECRNPDGFKTSVSSDGILCDGTPPIVGSIFHRTAQNQSSESDYQFSTSNLEVYWNPGRDPENGIQEYLVAVGSGADRDDVRGFFSVGMATEVKIVNLTMNSGSTYYVTLEVVNNAGMTSRASSNGITVDATPPVITKVELQSSRTAPDLIGPGDYLSGEWNSYDGESDIDFTEYCFGTTQGGCQVANMQRVPGNETSVTCFECTLKHMYTYFMTVRVWNRAGLFSLAHSKGVTVDLTPPTSGEISLKPLYMPCLETCRLGATFGGFIDNESGIKDCKFRIKTANGSSVTTAQATSTKNRLIASNLTLKHGENYKITVVCTNNLGEKSEEVDSQLVRIDNSPPEKGFVIISPDRNHDILRHHTGCHFLNTTLRVYWSGFHDDESDIAGFRIAIGRAPLRYDVMPFRNFAIDSEAKFDLNENYGLSKGDTIFGTVEATNKAGLTTKVSSPATRLLSDKDSTLLNEGDFQCVNV